MKASINVLSLFLLLFLFSGYCFSQNNYASNIQTTISSDDQKLFINYDIIVNDGSKYFNVVLQLVYEGQALTPNPNNLYGDFGNAMTPGSKLIYWNYATDFSGDISKVKVELFAYREDEPKASFTTETLSGNFYAPCEIKFTNTSTNCDRYEWNFSDVNSGMENNSFEKNPTHVFKKGGRYTISLTVINSNLDLKNHTTETIVVKEHEPTIADFKVIGIENLKNKSVPITIEFKNLSTNANEFSWDFGDPNSGRNKNTSIEKDPSHKYKNPGQYQIELTAKNTFSKLSDVKVMELALPGKPLKETTTKSTVPSNSDYLKHKKKKNIWIASTAATAVIGSYCAIKSNSLYDDYKTATGDAADLRNKSENYQTMSMVSFGLSAISAVQVIIQANKQSKAKKQLGWNVVPLDNGGAITLSYRFK